MPKKFMLGITILCFLIITGVGLYFFIKQESKPQAVSPIVDNDLLFLESIASKGLTYDEAKNLPAILNITPAEWATVTTTESKKLIDYPKRIQVQPNVLTEQDYQALGHVDFKRQDLLAAAGKTPVQKQLQADGENVIRITPQSKADENLFYAFGDEIMTISYGSILNSNNDGIATWFRRTQYLPVVDLSLVKATTFNGKPGLIIAYGVDQLNMCAYVASGMNIYSYCFGGDVPPERMKDYLPLLEEMATRSQT